MSNVKFVCPKHSNGLQTHKVVLDLENGILTVYCVNGLLFDGGCWESIQFKIDLESIYYNTPLEEWLKEEETKDEQN